MQNVGKKKKYIVDYHIKLFYISINVLFPGCNNGKNKSGYNKLETDDMESDSEFYHKGMFISICQHRLIISDYLCLWD